MSSDMPPPKPEVSVVMAVYNGEAYVRDAIQSILDQTLADFELIVVDDGSTDRTGEVLSAFNDSRIKIFRNEHNLGITKTRNRATSEARGNFIAVLDSDDLADRARLSTQLAFLRRNVSHAMVASWAEYVQEDGSPAWGMPIWRVPLPGECAASILLFQNFICHSSVMLRASMLPHPVYRDFEPSEDYELWARLAKQHRIDVIPEVLVRYRMHDKNVSKTLESRQQATSLSIVQRQLERLGIEASPEELELHHKMFWDPTFQDRKALVGIRTWLDKILNANSQSKIYDQAALKRTVEFQWIKACKCACKRNPFLVFFCAFSSHGAQYRLKFIRYTIRFLGRRLTEVTRLG